LEILGSGRIISGDAFTMGFLYGLYTEDHVTLEEKLFQLCYNLIMF